MKQLALVWILLSAMSPSISFAEIQNFEFVSAGLKRVEVKNLSGKVRLTAQDAGKARVSVDKRVFSETCDLKVERKGDLLFVRVEQKALFAHGECRVDLALRLPKTLDLSLEVAAGDVSAIGFQGRLAFEVGSGDLQADGAFAELRGRSGSGDVSVKGIAGGGEVKSGSGEVHLTFTESAREGQIDLTLGSGDALLLFPKGAKIRSNLKSGSGDLNNELGDTPQAPYLVSMRTGSGDLKIRTY